MLLAGPLTLVTGLLLHRFLRVSAPYGRWAAGAGPGWGPLLNGRLAWVVSAPLHCSHLRAPVDHPTSNPLLYDDISLVVHPSCSNTGMVHACGRPLCDCASHRLVNMHCTVASQHYP
jgi:hypothetical protein